MTQETLEEIKGLLEDIKSILLIENLEKIEKYKTKFLEEKSEQVKIYKLCKGLTAEDISKKINKSTNYVNTNLVRLREKGLIKSTNKNNKTIHEQTI